MDSDNHPLPQPSSYLADYSPHHNTLVPTVTDSNSRKRIVCHRKELGVEDSTDRFYRQVTIGTLPDDALLEIFDSYVDELGTYYEYSDRWRTLVHVCQRWRNVVFASPRRLNPHLSCYYGSPVNEMLNIWPEIPVIVNGSGDPTLEEANNVVAALGHTDRVTGILLHSVPSSASERFAAAMQVPFPVLRSIWWVSDDRDNVAPVISDGFLGGSAPRLESFWSNGIPFPALPKLFLSTTDLSKLYLWNIPHSGYISTEEMATCLFALTSLEELSLSFRSPQSRPPHTSRPPRPSARALLPSLTSFRFQGVTEYMEDFVARIDVPLLENIEITFFNQLLFDILQLPKFIRRMDKFKAFDLAEVFLYNHAIIIILSPLSERFGPAKLELSISCRKLEWQLSSLPQVSGSTLSTLSHVERLEICWGDYDSPPYWQDDIETSQWLELLQPFTTVKDLHIANQYISRIAPVLQELSGDQASEVLPALQNLYLNRSERSEPVQKAIEQFVAARQLSGQPVAVHVSEIM